MSNKSDSGKTGTPPISESVALAPTGMVVLGEDGQPIALEVVAVRPATGEAPAASAGPPAVSVPALDPMLGAVIDGKYKIERELGSGGMGIVYLALQISLNRWVALKVLHGHVQGQGLHRFQREAETTAQLAHRGIVAVFDSGVLPDRRPYLVLEYLRGEDLAAHFTRAGRLPLWQICEIARQVASAMAYAHAVKVIHRDLKPENIFLLEGREGEPDWVKVVDFGISRIMRASVSQVTIDGSRLGTIAYMAPEQIALDGAELDARIDIYALAAIIYELLTGEPPHGMDDAALVIARKRSLEPRAIRTLRTDVPAALDELILRALSPNRDDRPGSMAEFARLLQEAMQGTSTALPTVAPVAQPSPTTHESTPSVVSQPRFTLRPWMIALAVILALGIVGMVLRSSGSAPDAPTSAVVAPATPAAAPSAPVQDSVQPAATVKPNRRDGGPAQPRRKRTSSKASTTSRPAQGDEALPGDLDGKPLQPGH